LITDKNLKRLLSLASGSEPTLADIVKINNMVDLLGDCFNLLRLEYQHSVAGFRTLRILDFDLIYPTCWPVQRRVPTSFERMCSFPTTAAYFFRHTKSAFTIPPGSFFELSRYLGLLREKLSTSANHLSNTTKQLESTLASHRKRDQATANEQILLVERLPKMVGAEIDEFIGAGMMFHKLERLLTHPMHLHWLDLVNGTGTRISTAVLNRLCDALDYLRPNHSVNNFADALNISALVALIESGQRTTIHEESHLFPLLATGTGILRKMNVPLCLQQLEQKPHLGEEDEVQAVSPRYLLLDTAISTYCEDSARAKQTFISVLLNSNHKARKAWGDFWCELWQKTQPRRPWASIKISEFINSLGLQNFMENLGAFFNEAFEPIVSILSSEARADRQHSTNYIEMRKRLVKGLLSGQKLEHLLSQEDEFLNSENLDRGYSLVKLYLSILREGETLMLTEPTLDSLRRNKILCDNIEGVQSTNGLLQFRPTCTYSSTHLLEWDGDLDSGTHQCCWTYRIEFTKLLSHLLAFRDAVEKRHGNHTGELRMAVYGGGQAYQSEWCKTLDSETLFDAIVARSTEPDYIHFEHPTFDFFAEIEPFSSQSEELQVAVRYEYDLNVELAELHFATAVTRLDPNVLSDLLQDYDSILKRECGRRKPGGTLDDQQRAV